MSPKSRSTQLASSRPSTLVGGAESWSFMAFSISSTIVRTCLTLLPLVITNASVIERMSPTSRATMSSPFLADAAAVATATRRRTAGAPVKQRPRRSSSRSIVEAAFGNGTHHGRRDEAVDRAPGRQSRPQVPGRDVEPRDRDVLDPPAGPGWFGVHIAGALHDHERREVTGLLEHAPCRHVADGVGAQHEKELALRRRERDERVVGDRRLVPLDLDRGRLHAVDA